MAMTSKARGARRQAFKDSVAAIHALESSAHFFVGWDRAGNDVNRIDSVRTARMRLIIAALEFAAHVDGENAAKVVAALKAVSR